jgi:hypothetical protein
MSIPLDPKIIRDVSKQVYKRFPEVNGVRPTIKKRQGEGKILAGDKSSNFLLTFHGTVDVGDGKKMERWVRVVVNIRGNILKMTTSR